ncbi:DUF961 family protein [Alkalicoccobacillus plakortidis]|uniref:YdcP family protein n=1 Tax=Alkalicoccobacillus plakortidis TaxID=444060 RepID=A0ABT0XJU8_9BACI|nr:DUF961 family protein [Alkalicoccobacillus plakortidis]MCM2675509.1 YdcP family protein [Alkalicoccobacillus plakortidis]
MNFKSGIAPISKDTFGTLIFMGLEREKFYFDRTKGERGERTDILEARIYNLGSSIQKGQIEVTIPDYIDLKEFEFMSEVELVHPRITARAQANGNFANVIYTLTAEDILPAGQSQKTTLEKKQHDTKEPVGAGAEKK